MMVFRHDEVKPIQTVPKVWTGECTCAYCGLDLQTARPMPGEADVYLYDFKTLRGSWATACRLHYLVYRHSMVLGTGKGQEYKRDAVGRFIKSRG